MTPRLPDPVDASDASRVQGSGRSLPWLLAIFVISMGLVLGLRGFFADLNDELQRRSANERARLFIGEEIVQGIQAIESHLYQMAVTHNAVGYQRILREIDEQLTKIHHDLNVLQKGGTARRSLRLNIAELQEIAQEVIFQPSAEDKQLVMEQIEVGSKLDQVKEMVGELEELLKQRWEALEKDDVRAFYRIESEIALRLKRAPPYFERLNENANRLFVEGERRLDALEDEVRAKRGQLGRMETVLIALVLFLAAAIGFQFLRRLKFALDEAQRFGKEVAHQKAQVATILDTLSDGVYATNLEGHITFINTTAERMFGRPASELLGQLAHAATHHSRPDGTPYPAHECPLFGMLKRGQPLDGEEWFVHRDGHCFPVSFRTNPLHQDGLVIGSLVSFQDISARRAAEARIRLLEMAIQESDQGILITAADATEDGGTIQYVNSGFTRITGYAATEVVGRRTALLRGPTTDAQRVGQLVSALQAGQRFRAEIDYQRKDGTLLVAEIDYSPVHDGEGRLTHFIALLSDIGMRRAAEQALREAHDQALAHARLKSAFLANMSHEVRTPMNGVIGMTDLLLDTPLNAEQREFAQLVRDSAQSLLTIINDILDFSKIEAGKLDIEAIDFSMTHVIEGIVSLLAPKAQEKQLSLTSHVDPALAIRLHGDSTRLRQILLNLAGNAVKFTSQGSVAIRVLPASKTSSAETRRVRFEVQDSGIGIAPAAQARLFQSFSQADSSTTRKFGGTGLGLAISKQLVTLMQGEIGVISEEGQGATFWFELPLEIGKTVVPDEQELPVADETAGTATVKAIDTSAGNGELRAALTQGRLVLLVEDNLTNQKLAQIQLRKLGYETHIVADGQQAVAAFDTLPFAAILMDCQMPVMDGFEATTLIRKAEAAEGRPRIPIIAMTANAMQGDRERCLAIGMDDYLSKPINSEQLRNTLAHWTQQLAPLAKAGAPSPAASPHPVDFSPLRDLCGNDAAVLTELLGLFIATTPPLLDRLIATIAQQEVQATKAIAHEVKGACGNLGFNGMMQIARRLEESLAANDWAMTEAVAAELAAAYRQVVAQIHAEGLVTA
ncbi:MAG: ATP-binding protein [Rhodocyclaceae bacterium]|nr:ATP-binding protein [Rhodocyclaceae bacterium]MDZ4214156.1 ATP-binding protein [Rhodocyclaceae bacterium]